MSLTVVVWLEGIELKSVNLFSLNRRSDSTIKLLNSLLGDELGERLLDRLIEERENSVDREYNVGDVFNVAKSVRIIHVFS